MSNHLYPWKARKQCTPVPGKMDLRKFQDLLGMVVPYPDHLKDITPLNVLAGGKGEVSFMWREEVFRVDLETLGVWLVPSPGVVKKSSTSILFEVLLRQNVGRVLF